MKKASKRKKSIKKVCLVPMAAAIGVAMAAPVFAGQIYIGDTETVVSYDENGNKVITLVFDPAKTPDFFREQYLTPPQPEKTAEGKEEQAQPEKETLEMPFQKILPLTEAPEVGTVLADIHYVDESGGIVFTEPYLGGSRGQCTWYARGRLWEVSGIKLPLLGNAKEWLNTAPHCENVRVGTDLSDVPEQAIAVYVPRADDSLPGHVCFIEYVERDGDGNPLYIYYTDANGKADKEKNAYTPGYDGKVTKESFEEFRGAGELELIGYLVPKYR